MAQVRPLTEEELEQISTVFHQVRFVIFIVIIIFMTFLQFETGVRSGRIRSGVSEASSFIPCMIDRIYCFSSILIVDSFAFLQLLII